MACFIYFLLLGKTGGDFGMFYIFFTTREDRRRFWHVLYIFHYQGRQEEILACFIYFLLLGKTGGDFGMFYIFFTTREDRRRFWHSF